LTVPCHLVASLLRYVLMSTSKMNASFWITDSTTLTTHCMYYKSKVRLPYFRAYILALDSFAAGNFAVNNLAVGNFAVDKKS
jgi:hypothetical protein